MSISETAQAIIDTCESGPIPGGISIKIKQLANSIIEMTSKTAPKRIVRQWTDELQIEAENALHDLLQSNGVKSKQSRQNSDVVLAYLFARSIDGDLVTEKTIAFDVLGFTSEFDPASDQRVRILMSRTRKKVNDYFDNNPDAKVIFEIPYGSYEMLFYADGDLLQ